MTEPTERDDDEGPLTLGVCDNPHCPHCHPRPAENTSDIRRVLLNAWHDLKWYQANYVGVAAPPRHVKRTLIWLETVLRPTPDVGEPSLCPACSGRGERAALTPPPAGEGA